VGAEVEVQKLNVVDPNLEDKADSRQRLSQELRHLSEILSGPNMTYHDLFSHLTTRGHALVSFFLSLPFLVPIPIPGLSMVLGPALALAGCLMAFNRPPWLPKPLLAKKCDSVILRKFFLFSSRLMKRIEVFIRPRGRFFHRHDWMIRFNGSMIAVCGLLLALPLPPGTNVPPALGALFLSIGTLEEDGIFIVLGYVVTTLSMFFLGLILFFGYEGIRFLMLQFFQ